MKKIFLSFLVAIFFATNAFSQSIENVIIILDCSLSMEDEIHGERKIDVAKNVIKTVLSELPPNVHVGLRAYGHKKNALKSFIGIDKCEVSELLVPLGPDSRQRIFNELSKLQPVGWTPICFSLEQACSYDFGNLPGKKRIILVSDGMETCSGSPCEAAVDLIKRHNDVSIDVIGLDVSSDPSIISNLRCVALTTRGKFYTADSPEEFLRSMQHSFSVSKDVQGRIMMKE